jgi:hypothetical protein
MSGLHNEYDSVVSVINVTKNIQYMAKLFAVNAEGGSAEYWGSAKTSRITEHLVNGDQSDLDNMTQSKLT